MQDWLREVFTGVRGIVAYVTLCLVVAIGSAAFAGSTASKTINETIDIRIDSRVDSRINESVLPMLKEIKTSVDFLVESSYSDYVVKLEKQVEKIRSDPSDIKTVDIEDILQKWKAFPDARKTDNLVMKYAVVKEWYSKNQ